MSKHVVIHQTVHLHVPTIRTKTVSVPVPQVKSKSVRKRVVKQRNGDKSVTGQSLSKIRQSMKTPQGIKFVGEQIGGGLRR